MRIVGTALIAIPLMFGACKKGTADSPDNTGRNKVVEPTADQADKTGPAVDQMAKVRKAILADDSLSTTAHNCKVVVQGNTLTLSGPVNSTDEKARVGEIASQSGLQIINNLEVKP